MDGSVTPRAEMAGQVARWANQRAELWRSRPVRGDAGIVFVPESEIFNFVQQGNTRHYAESARGAYQAFFDSNIQADFVHIDDIGAYPLIYLPYPIHLKGSTSAKLAGYVRNGGILVSEGLPGYFGEGGRVGTRQPNQGLGQLFGARESYVEFTPDLLDDLTLEVQGRRVGGRFFLQQYELAGGRNVGEFAPGKVAAVEHRSGKGRTLLIGTFPGASYFLKHSSPTREFFAGLLQWAGLRQWSGVSDPMLRARLHQGRGGSVLWVVNPSREPRVATVTLDARAGDFRSARELWQTGQPDPVVSGSQVRVSVADRNVAVVRLDP
jgi:beta-galactosidase